MLKSGKSRRMRVIATLRPARKSQNLFVPDSQCKDYELSESDVMRDRTVTLLFIKLFMMNGDQYGVDNGSLLALRRFHNWVIELRFLSSRSPSSPSDATDAHLIDFRCQTADVSLEMVSSWGSDLFGTWRLLHLSKKTTPDSNVEGFPSHFEFDIANCQGCWKR